jgi:hypothetical protein
MALLIWENQLVILEIILITDFQVLKKPNFTINYKVVQSGMEANKVLLLP